MNKTTMSSRAMSAINCPTSKQIKHINKNNLLSPQQSTLTGSQNHLQLNNINQIFRVYFPDIIANLPIIAINLENYQEILHRLLKQIRNMQMKAITGLENQNQGLEMEIKIVRDSRDRALEKIKILEKELAAIREKIKGKQYDCFGKNQEIFNLKQKIQNMEKTIVMKNIEVKNVYEQLEEMKLESENQIEMYSNINEKFKVQNQKLKAELRKSMLAIAQLETSLEASQIQKSTISIHQHQHQQHHLKPQPQHQPQHQPHILKQSCYEPFSDQNRYNSVPISRNRSCSASNKSQNGYFYQKQPQPTKLDLLSEVKQLRENQSALIDRLAERDQMIENLEKTITRNFVQ